MSAVYGGDCVSDDYIETLTPETPVIDITTEISTDEMETAEKVTENVTTVDDVRPIIEEIAENITETNQNIPSEEGVYYEVIFKTRYLLLKILEWFHLYFISLLNYFRHYNLFVRQWRCFAVF